MVAASLAITSQTGQGQSGAAPGNDGAAACRRRRRRRALRGDTADPRQRQRILLRPTDRSADRPLAKTGSGHKLGRPEARSHCSSAARSPGPADVSFAEVSAEGRCDREQAHVQRAVARAPLAVSCTSRAPVFGLSTNSTSPSAASSSASRCMRGGWSAAFVRSAVQSMDQAARGSAWPNAPPPQLVINLF